MNINLPQATDTIVKLVLAFTFFMYVVYAFLLSKQIRLMNKSFDTPLALFFALLGKIHLFISLGIFILSLLNLLSLINLL